jgi:hypothetical protein
VIDLTQLRELEPFVWRAPSAHNTQPWQLAYSVDMVRLSFDPARVLTVSDPDRRDLLLSLGGFVEAMLIAAADKRVPVTFEPEIDVDRCQIGRFLVSSTLYHSDFTTADLLARQTSRLPYKVDLLDSAIVEELRHTLCGAIALHILDARDLAPLMVEANRAMFGSIAIVGELRRWLRLTGRARHMANDGLTAQCLNLARAEALALKFVLSRSIHPWLCGLGLHSLLARQAAAILKSTGHVLVLSQPIGNAIDMLSAGRMLLQIWLLLARRGYFVHPLSEIIDAGVTYRGLVSMLRLDESDRILSVFRVGRSMPPPRSRRLR